MKRSALLSIYRAVDGLFGFVYGLIYRHRAKIGKEDTSRLLERHAKTKTERPKGTLIWIHGASVGEISLGMALADKMREQQPDLQFLFTSQTMSSAKLLSENMQPHQIHQYLPMDTAKAMGKFLDHWRPALGILLESEIWPNLIMTSKQRQIPLALVNARMNEKSRNNWRKRNNTAKYLFSQFNWITAADEQTAIMLESFIGQVVSRPGNLKTLIKPKAPNSAELAKLSKLAANRPVWLAASSHSGEEDVLLQAHQQILQQYPEALLILAPRHPNRRQEITDICKQNNISYCLRSEHITIGKTVWVADTIGEMQYWLELAQIVFVAGSLNGGKGHNPIEAIIAGKSVLSGSNVMSFAETYDKLEHFGAVKFTDSPEQISVAIIYHFNNPKRTKLAITNAANELADEARKMSQQIIPALLNLLNRGDK
ncbi:MAG: 3-deoxy-D-manno-octulosonic acid transferase [Robiginitomaculum sp.]|nr:3-deoxy-D-manno-octulosonic acid transferase [Robiginitomaculum sp.]